MCMGECHDKEGKEMSPSTPRKMHLMTAKEALGHCQSLCEMNVEDGTCRKTCDMMFQCAVMENKDEDPSTTSTSTEAEQHTREDSTEETVVLAM